MVDVELFNLSMPKLTEAGLGEEQSKIVMAVLKTLKNISEKSDELLAESDSPYLRIGGKNFDIQKVSELAMDVADDLQPDEVIEFPNLTPESVGAETSAPVATTATSEDSITTALDALDNLDAVEENYHHIQQVERYAVSDDVRPEDSREYASAILGFKSVFNFVIASRWNKNQMLVQTMAFIAKMEKILETLHATVRPRGWTKLAFVADKMRLIMGRWVEERAQQAAALRETQAARKAPGDQSATSATTAATATAAATKGRGKRKADTPEHTPADPSDATAELTATTVTVVSLSSSSSSSSSVEPGDRPQVVAPQAAVLQASAPPPQTPATEARPASKKAKTTLAVTEQPPSS